MLSFDQLHNIDHVKQYNEDMGYHFFAPFNMRHFCSRVSSKVRHVKRGILFITSEQFSGTRYTAQRFYTLRVLLEDGSINKISEFQEYDTLRQAKNAMKSYTD